MLTHDMGIRYLHRTPIKYRLLQRNNSRPSNGRRKCRMPDYLSLGGFRTLFDTAVEYAVKRAQQFMAEPLPRIYTYRLLFQGMHEEDRFTLDDIAWLLYQDGFFPDRIDVAVGGIVHDHTLILFQPFFVRYPVGSIGDTPNDPPGTGPFLIGNPRFPLDIYKRLRPWSLADLKEAGERTLRFLADDYRVKPYTQQAPESHRQSTTREGRTNDIEQTGDYS